MFCVQESNRTRLHIFGNTTMIWHKMADAGASVLSLDDAVDLGKAKQQVGNRVALLGNVRPTATMFSILDR
jgi:uroporphyrinogen decarboxylase